MSFDVIPEQRLLQHLIGDALEVCLSYTRGRKRRWNRTPIAQEEYEYNLRALQEVDSSLLEAAGFRHIPAVMKTVKAIVNGDTVPVPARRNGRRRKEVVCAESE